MRDFQASILSRDYDRPNTLGGDNKTWNEKWNMLIDTSYKFLNTAQCQSSQGSGLVPNWALVTEKDSNTLEAYSGSFSGSGTPQYEFGAEASRTMWRVAFDAAAYPEEADDQAVPFLDPLYQKLADGFISNPDESTVFAFEENSVSCTIFFARSLVLTIRYAYLLASRVRNLTSIPFSLCLYFFSINFSSSHARQQCPMSFRLGTGMVSCMVLSCPLSWHSTIRT